MSNKCINKNGFEVLYPEKELSNKVNVFIRRDSVSIKKPFDDLYVEYTFEVGKKYVISRCDDFEFDVFEFDGDWDKLNDLDQVWSVDEREGYENDWFAGMSYHMHQWTRVFFDGIDVSLEKPGEEESWYISAVFEVGEHFIGEVDENCCSGLPSFGHICPISEWDKYVREKGLRYFDEIEVNSHDDCYLVSRAKNCDKYVVARSKGKLSVVKNFTYVYFDDGCGYSRFESRDSNMIWVGIGDKFRQVKIEREFPYLVGYDEDEYEYASDCRCYMYEDLNDLREVFDIYDNDTEEFRYSSEDTVIVDEFVVLENGGIDKKEILRYYNNRLK